MGSGATGGEDLAHGEARGVIPRVVCDLFTEIAARAESHDVTVRASFMELYREDLIDLISPAAASAPKLAIREDPSGQIVIRGLTEVAVSSAAECLAVLARGSAGRTTASTRMNDTSSRSHAIFSITVEAASRGADGVTVVSKLHFVDLAGSERAKRTQASGERLREGIAINSGLLALGNVISALGTAQEGGAENAEPRHIPYRDSKLTRLLQDSLGGNARTLVIACVSPADDRYVWEVCFGFGFGFGCFWFLLFVFTISVKIFPLPILFRPPPLLFSFCEKYTSAINRYQCT
jgi:kinesin family protein 4/21/27